MPEHVPAAPDHPAGPVHGHAIGQTDHALNLRIVDQGVVEHQEAQGIPGLPQQLVGGQTIGRSEDLVEVDDADYGLSEGIYTVFGGADGGGINRTESHGDG